MTTVVYTDGACSGNPGPGGWAWAVPGGAFAAGNAAQTTNQRMEVQAAYEAVKALDGTVEVVSDSTYVINCFQKKLWEGWLRNGWKNSQKKPVANQDLWEPFIELVRSREHEITFRWVKGHSGDSMNDLVDGLAVEAAQKQAPRSGDSPPTGELPEDQPRKSAKSGADAPSGHLLLIAGHRPPELGGYDDNAIKQNVQRKLNEIVAAKAQMFDDLVVVSGLSLGAEQMGVRAAIESNVALAAVLPFPNSDARWPNASREVFKELLANARDEILLTAQEPTDKASFGAALGKRDQWLANHVSEAVVVWDGKEPYVGRFVTVLRDYLGEDNVWIVNPKE